MTTSRAILSRLVVVIAVTLAACSTPQPRVPWTPCVDYGTWVSQAALAPVREMPASNDQYELVTKIRH